MNILQVVPSYYPAFVYGGPIFSIHSTCLALARSGVEVRVATTNANGDSKLDVETDKPVFLGKNYQVRYYDDTIIGRYSWAFTKNLGHDIITSDVVHLQDVFSTHAAWTLMLAWKYHKPLLVSARGAFTVWGLKSKRPFLKKLWLTLFSHPFVKDYKRVAWHATSDQERIEVLACFPKARVYVIPNGLDCAAYDKVPVPSRIDYFERFFPDASVMPEHAKVLVGLGRLHKKKAFEVAIKAIHKLAPTQPDAVLLIAGGDDGERKPLLRLIDELGLQKRVALVGEVEGDDKIRFLKGADLFVFTSHNENFGNVVLEALASRLPVIASRNTPWQVLEEKGAGLWVDNTPEAFEKACMDLLSRNSGRMEAEMRKLVLRYDLNTIAEAFKKTYTELIDG